MIDHHHYYFCYHVTLSLIYLFNYQTTPLDDFVKQLSDMQKQMDCGSAAIAEIAKILIRKNKSEKEYK